MTQTQTPTPQNQPKPNNLSAIDKKVADDKAAEQRQPMQAPAQNPEAKPAQQAPDTETAPQQDGDKPVLKN